MALLFRREAPVLHFGPRLPKDMRWSKRRFVLWPALMYRVVAPEVRARQLNVLQKAVLGMCRAGVTTVDRIGARLHIHPDLAELVALELHRRGLLGTNGLPTEKGYDLIEEETLEARRMVTGHVFQDPWTGDLWPRFIEKLDYVELQQNPNTGFPDLVLGSKGKPRRERSFMVLPGDLALPPTPGASEIVRVTRRHRSALRRSASYEIADDDDTFAHAGSVALERVSLVDDRPTPVFVTSFMYLPEAGDLGGEWHACDPFGLGVSPMLRRALEREMRSSNGLRTVLEGMIGQSLDLQIEAQQRLAGEVRAMATNNVEKALSVSARDLPQFEDLVALEYARVEADLLGAACPEHKLRDLLGAARRALEGTFKAIFDRHPPRQAWRRVYTDRRPVEDNVYCQGVYEASAKAMGFRVPLPEALARVKPNHVKAACYPDGGWRLRGAIIAALLAARDDARHPLRRAAAREPGLLELLDDVATKAGGAVHAGAARLSLPSVLPVVADVHRAVGLLSGLGQPLDSART
ncbi:hypothetical protein D7X30_22455 [Corallococcus sp. AB011P]|uniref:hypothetical protein n=1 Tax=Corallococcus sp. AB011P TaxID=2316735 RepID=UPI000EA20F17|nr:hypothetical protein [Corallococcus sp. AB011P]RKG56895.1 hypothetical protein D7X30_22455 [Corallococcus sp. AB011P]